MNDNHGVHAKHDNHDDFLVNNDNDDHQAADHPVLALEWAPQLVRLVTHITGDHHDVFVDVDDGHDHNYNDSGMWTV